MTLRSARALLLLSALLLVAACRKTQPAGADAGAAPDAEAPKVVEAATRDKIQAFASGAELDGFLKELLEAQKRDRSNVARRAKGEASPPPAAAPAEAAKADSKEAESVTNVQHAGVDEGGIVKLHGDYLIVLRRGRLFSVKVSADALTPVSVSDAFGPDVDPRGAWYDEMLLSGNTIVVIGYSYQRGGTEIALFELGTDGRISYRSTHHLRSNDYYSSRNYASRLIGKKLVFYTPLHLRLSDADLYGSFPAVRRWSKGATAADFKRIVEPTRVYRPLVSSTSLTLHTVTSCDLSQADLACSSTAVMGPSGRVFYVSPGAVYVWMTDYQRRGATGVPRSIVYRMPLDGSAPTAVRTVGGPIDQFSFLEGREARELVARATDAGFSLAMHAIGNAATDEVLAAVMAARGRQRDVPAPRIEHASFLRPDQPRRIADAGISVVVQPAFLRLPAMDLVRMPKTFATMPLRALLDAGACVAGSSDAPVIDFDPLAAMQSAITRKTASGDVLDPGQAIEPAEALAMYTREAARVCGELESRGTLEPGKRADFVVLSADPLRALGEARVEATWVGGRVAWEGADGSDAAAAYSQ